MFPKGKKKERDNSNRSTNKNKSDFISRRSEGSEKGDKLNLSSIDVANMSSISRNS